MGEIEGDSLLLFGRFCEKDILRTHPEKQQDEQVQKQGEQKSLDGPDSIFSFSCLHCSFCLYIEIVFETGTFIELPFGVIKLRDIFTQEWGFQSHKTGPKSLLQKKIYS
jgi:hypothetical protein